MKLDLIVRQLKDLKKHFEKGANLKNYCECKNISYTSTLRLLNKYIEKMQLRTAYNILGLTPERNIPQGVLSTKIQDLLEIKDSFIKGLL